MFKKQENNINTVNILYFKYSFPYIIEFEIK
jgi:hypothetical protein